MKKETAHAVWLTGKSQVPLPHLKLLWYIYYKSGIGWSLYLEWGGMKRIVYKFYVFVLILMFCFALSFAPGDIPPWVGRLGVSTTHSFTTLLVVYVALFSSVRHMNAYEKCKWPLMLPQWKSFSLVESIFVLISSKTVLIFRTDDPRQWKLETFWNFDLFCSWIYFNECLSN